MVLRDAMFSANGQLLFDDKNHTGIYGDVVLVNGRPWPVMRVERRKYRFRVLNAAISRGFRLRLDNGDPFTVTATDGGLMPVPALTRELRIGMAERYEIVIDFAKYKTGQRVVLQNMGVKNSIDFDNTDEVMAFDVVSDATDTSDNAVPDVLNPKAPAMDLLAGMAKRTREFEFIRTNGMWTINGKTWAEVQASDYDYVWADPALDDIEIWEFKNTSGGWFHPVHVHLVDYKVLDRNGAAPFTYEMGPEDVVYVGENETVRVIAKFGPHQGKYMIHCHNLSQCSTSFSWASTSSRTASRSRWPVTTTRRRQEASPRGCRPTRWTSSASSRPARNWRRWCCWSRRSAAGSAGG
jgi:spore coat protein A